jgi:carboxyl-terminal processing protease
MKMLPDWAARGLLGAVVAAGLVTCDVPRLDRGPAPPTGVPAPTPAARAAATLAAATPTAPPVAPTPAPTATSGATGASPAALAYLSYAVDYIQQHGLHSDQVDWATVRERAFNPNLTAQTPADTYPVIQTVLDQLPVHGHSSLVAPSRVAQYNEAGAAALGLRVSYAARKVVSVDFGSPGDRAGIRVGDTILSLNDTPVESLAATQFFAQIYIANGTLLRLRRGADQPISAQLNHAAVDPGALARGRRLAGHIGYIAVPGLAASPIYNYYVDIMQQIIADIDQTPTCGWVVDLQGNTGGDMWPMLAGIGPILGGGRAGSFAPPADSPAWMYRDGQALLGETVLAQAPTPYHLQRPDPPVAVLTDRQTVSAGEAIAVAFRGRPQTRSFGGATAGLPTYNDIVPLSDGAALQLTVVMDADRTGQTYDAPIVPDVPTLNNFGDRGTDADPALRTAVDWLRQQPACAGP